MVVRPINVPAGGIMLALLVLQSAISLGVGQTTVFVNITNTSLVTTPDPPTCPPDYTDCRCVFTRNPFKHYYDYGDLPRQRSIWRDLLAALYGFPFGVALSLLTYFLYYYYCKSDKNANRKPTKKWDWRSNIKGRISPIYYPDGKLKSK